MAERYVAIPDVQGLIELLRSRYPQGAKCDTVLDLTRNNPDIAQQIRTVQTHSMELFGMSFQKYLLQEGLLLQKRSAAENSLVEPDLNDLAVELAQQAQEKNRRKEADWKSDFSIFEEGSAVVEIPLSDETIRSEPVAENCAAITDGQAAEVHKIMYRYDPRMEFITMDGRHIGFIAASKLRGITSVKRIGFGQAWDARLKVGADGKVCVIFPRELAMRDTCFPERTMLYNWKRKDFDLKMCPIRDALFSVQVNADIYITACGDDVYRQYMEFKMNHAEKFARQMILKEADAYEKQCIVDNIDEPEPFFENGSSLALLENIPLGTEFEVKIDTVYIRVPNDSWRALHAGGTEEYAYPVPAFVLFHHGVRIANIPLVMQSDDVKTSYSAFWAFWKWCKEPTLNPRAWLVNFHAPDAIWETDLTCTFAIGFFSGTERPRGELDLQRAWSYDRYPEGCLPVAQLMDVFARTEKIDLSQYDADGSSKLPLEFRDGTGGTLPLGMFTVDPEEEKDDCTRNWMTIDQVYKSIDPSPPPKENHFALLTKSEFSQFVFVAGIHVGNRPQICLHLRGGEELKIVREPENPYDRNAIAIYNTKGEQCGFVPGKMARWITPVLDAGVIWVKSAKVEWVTDWGEKNFAQLEITILFGIDNTRNVVVAWCGNPADAPEIPFLVMGKDPENPEGLFLIDDYNRNRAMWMAGRAYCDEAFGENDDLEAEPTPADDMLNPKERAKSKTGDDEYIVNLYVLLTNDKKLRRLRRSQTEFCDIYQKDMPMLAKVDIAALRKELLAELKDEARCVQYAERFRERTLEERFYMSTRNLFYMLEGSELDEQAVWAIENTKEWYRAGEYPGVRRLMDATLEDIRLGVEDAMIKSDRSWTEFSAARRALHICLTDKADDDSDVDPTVSDFQLFIDSAVVDLCLRRDETRNSVLVLDTFPWYWGVTVRDIWEEAFKNEPRDLRDVPTDTDLIVNRAIAQVREKHPSMEVGDFAPRSSEDNL